MKALTPLALFFISATGSRAADVVLAAEGKAQAVIFAPARVMDDAVKNPDPASSWRGSKLEDSRRRLRESVRDLAAILERITGAKFEIVTGMPRPDEKRLPIFIAENAGLLGDLKTGSMPNSHCA
jgi:hypothetical protein